MGSFMSGTLSGSGRVAITGGGGPYIDIFAHLLSPGRTEFLNTDDPAKLLHAGYYGLGWDAPGSGTTTVNWFKYLDFEREVIAFAALTAYGDYLVWHMEGGATIEVGLDW